VRYAENTTVSCEQSRNEIERILQRYDATGFMYGWNGPNAVIAFQKQNKTIKFVLPLADKGDKQFWLTPTGRKRKDADGAYKAWEQSCRQRWRALALSIKARLEDVETGICSFEIAFLAFFVMPGGQTFGDWAVPQIENAYRTGNMPKALPGIGESSTL
jgi:hypothetical protein